MTDQTGRRPLIGPDLDESDGPDLAPLWRAALDESAPGAWIRAAIRAELDGPIEVVEPIDSTYGDPAVRAAVAAVVELARRGPDPAADDLD